MMPISERDPPSSWNEEMRYIAHERERYAADIEYARWLDSLGRRLVDYFTELQGENR